MTIHSKNTPQYLEVVVRRGLLLLGSRAPRGHQRGARRRSSASGLANTWRRFIYLQKIDVDTAENEPLNIWW